MVIKNAPTVDWNYMNKEQIGEATLYCGDCLDILPSLGKVDCVVTDPPYGVGLEYEGLDDSFDNWKMLMDAIIPVLKEKCDGPIVIPTSKIEGEKYLHNHNPIWRMCWFKGASATRCAIGFKDWEPTFIFGASPKKQIHDHFTAHANDVRKRVEGHPCPKPERWANHLVSKMGEYGETCLDPFMGSGTTGVACANLGRKFIGIEIEPKYFDIACERITAAYAQGRLFA